MKPLFPFPLAGFPALGGDLSGRARFFGLGEVRLAVLSLLSEEPRNGYQLMKELASRLGPLYRASSGTVYPVLKQMEKEGLVECRLEDGRRLYRLTRAGRKLLGTEGAAIRSIWSRAEETEDLGRQIGPHSLAVAGPLNELYAAAMRAARWAAGNPDREDRVRGILRGASAALNGLMAKEKP